MGLTRQQVIDDVLDRYEAHLAFLTVSTDTNTASVLTPTMPPSSQQPVVPKGAGDIVNLSEQEE